MGGGNQVWGTFVVVGEGVRGAEADGIEKLGRDGRDGGGQSEKNWNRWR